MINGKLTVFSKERCKFMIVYFNIRYIYNYTTQTYGSKFIINF